MGKLIPIFLMLIGAGGGIGAGLLLRPAAETETAMMDENVDETEMSDSEAGYPDAAKDADSGSNHESVEEEKADSGYGDSSVAAVEYVALQRQMIVPLVDGDRVGALIVLSLSIEATGGNMELIYEREPKLRDEFLQVLFRHANTGGFDGMFTSGEAMNDLKSALNAAASKVLGSISQEVLVTEILRQEL